MNLHVTSTIKNATLMIRPIRKGAEIVGRWRDQDWEENKQRNKGNRSSGQISVQKRQQATQ